MINHLLRDPFSHTRRRSKEVFPRDLFIVSIEWEAAKGEKAHEWWINVLLHCEERCILAHWDDFGAGASVRLCVGQLGGAWKNLLEQTDELCQF
jgi:hypothetical protein